MVILYPSVFSNENKDLNILYIPQLDTVLERIDTFKLMVDMNKMLILQLYGSEKAYYINKNRHEPLDNWIIRYDKGMGNITDITSLLVDMNIEPMNEDISDQVYRSLLFKVIEKTEGRETALNAMNKFIDHDLENINNDIYFYKHRV